MHFSTEIDIRASPQAVWELLTDGSRMPEWDPGMERFEGHIGENERITVHVRGQSRAFPVQVTTFEAPRKMVWEGGLPLGMFWGTRTFLLTPIDAGTHLRIQEEFTGWARWVIGRGVPDLTPSFEAFAQGLKARAEER